MTPDSKRVVAAVEDRFSALPRNLIDDILTLLPVHDAARTSVLSKNWRYIWAMLPNLVLDKHFRNELASNSKFVLKEIVDEILLQHIGDIVKILIDVAGVNSSSFADIDRWMRFVTRNGVKELILAVLRNSNYRIPSHIFSCPTLTKLELHNCLFKPPISFLGFQNLTGLYLNKMKFVPTPKFCVINVPRLVNLTLIRCKSTQYLNIVVSSRLKSLSVIYSRFDVDLSCFMNCKDLKTLYLVSTNPIRTEGSKLGKLLSSVPILEGLTFSFFFLEVQFKRRFLVCMLNCLRHLTLCVCFSKKGQTSYAVELIKSSPNLSKLQISVISGTTSNDVEAVLEYLESCVFLNQPLHNLKDVAMYCFEGSKAELLFIKLLFARTPSLIRMRIEQVEDFDSKEGRNITTELMGFPRASPKAELFYTPYTE